MSGDQLNLDAIEALYPELEDWEFIAHARVDLPALVAEVRRLHAQVEAARGFHSSNMLGHCQEDCCGEPFPCRTLDALSDP